MITTLIDTSTIHRPVCLTGSQERARGSAVTASAKNDPAMILRVVRSRRCGSFPENCRATGGRTEFDHGVAADHLVGAPARAAAVGSARSTSWPRPMRSRSAPVRKGWQATGMMPNPRLLHAPPLYSRRPDPDAPGARPRPTRSQPRIRDNSQRRTSTISSDQLRRRLRRRPAPQHPCHGRAAWPHTINALLRRLDAESESALGLAMASPTDWDPYVRPMMSVLDVYHFGTQHFDRHRRQLTL